MCKEKYQEALDYLFSRLPMFSRTGAPAYKPGLQTSIELASFFGNPHMRFKSIHVAGTNGKGSTSHLLASILQAQGYKTGLYTSPHLVDFRERMRINGEMIPEEKVVEFVDAWKKTGYNGHPSFFELTMILAFKWFAEEKVDYAVIEVGMGGRLDSTNIINPILSIITNISFDHTQFLGETLSQIAYEKSGIIKRGVPVVIGEHDSETAEVFRQRAMETASKIVFAENEASLNIERAGEEGGWIINYGGDRILLPLGGDYQKKNINTVIAAVEQLRRLNIAISETALRKGIKTVITSTGLMGRWMILERMPLTIADTGHNVAGLSYNFDQIKRLLDTGEFDRLKVVIGFVSDKDIDHIMDLLPSDAEYYVTNANIPRAMPAEELLKKFEQRGLKGRKYVSVEEAFECAKKEASDRDLIFIGGSTFIVADLLHSCACGAHGS